MVSISVFAAHNTRRKKINFAAMVDNDDDTDDDTDDNDQSVKSKKRVRFRSTDHIDSTFVSFSLYIYTPPIQIQHFLWSEIHLMKNEPNCYTLPMFQLFTMKKIHTSRNDYRIFS